MTNVWRIQKAAYIIAVVEAVLCIYFGVERVVLEEFGVGGTKSYLLPLPTLVAFSVIYVCARLAVLVAQRKRNPRFYLPYFITQVCFFKAVCICIMHAYK